VDLGFFEPADACPKNENRLCCLGIGKAKVFQGRGEEKKFLLSEETYILLKVYEIRI
jgi:hypothetical protein